MSDDMLRRADRVVTTVNDSGYNGLIRDLAARVRELEADNYKTGEREAKSLARIQQLMAERDALRRENDALRADAERYRWLRSSCSLARDELVQALTGKWPDDDDGEAMDAAIDAALAQGEKP